MALRVIVVLCVAAAVAVETKPLLFEKSLSDLFPDRGQVRIVHRPGGAGVAETPNVEVVVAHVNADGTLATACVGTAQAARDFMSGKTKPAAAAKE